MFNESQLAAALSCSPVRAATWCLPLRQAMQRFGTTTPRRAAHFLAQIGHESVGLSRTEEDLHYSPSRLIQVFGHRIPSDQASRYAGNPQALANRVYANRNGNSDEASGDGWRYRGRGPIQLTGRTNYVRVGTQLQLPLEDRPDMVLLPGIGALVAAAWWQENGLNSLADQDDVLAVSRRVNLGTVHTQRTPNGLADRIARTKRVKAALADAA
jgi:putative chitinase